MDADDCQIDYVELLRDKVEGGVVGSAITTYLTWTPSILIMSLPRSITTWYPSFDLNCHMVVGDNFAVAVLFLLSELIMAVHTLMACIESVSAEHVRAKHSVFARIEMTPFNELTSIESISK